MSSTWPDYTAPGSATRTHLYPVALVPPLPGAAPARAANLAVAAIGAPVAPEEDEGGSTSEPITVMQMTCSCGWRSPLLETPPATRCVTSPARAAPLLLVTDAFYRRCQTLWDAHLPSRRPHADASAQ
jgi:hypothetical protein